ncbi:hypothetical protein AX13_04720 [Comamonas aquatica DA1877]|uniref:Uncharacterized protein n=1 Tax=Comamonas aquatica DA1877 TaxID=1457173 RepID=A0A014MMP0_9BURK|nr:hypothetical protein AX13_04720 [Comamonas aquatica DA1877]
MIITPKRVLVVVLDEMLNQLIKGTLHSWTFKARKMIFIIIFRVFQQNVLMHNRVMYDVV